MSSKRLAQGFDQQEPTTFTHETKTAKESFHLQLATSFKKHIILIRMPKYGSMFMLKQETQNDLQCILNVRMRPADESNQSN